MEKKHAQSIVKNVVPRWTPDRNGGSERTNEQHESCGKTGDDGAHTRVAATAAAPSGTVPETSRNAPHPLPSPTPAASHDHNHSP